VAPIDTVPQIFLPTPRVSESITRRHRTGAWAGDEAGDMLHRVSIVAEGLQDVVFGLRSRVSAGTHGG
jgi:hypothetical protein